MTRYPHDAALATRQAAEAAARMRAAILAEPDGEALLRRVCQHQSRSYRGGAVTCVHCGASLCVHCNASLGETSEVIR